jgi:hypothetical protein
MSGDGIDTSAGPMIILVANDDLKVEVPLRAAVKASVLIREAQLDEPDEAGACVHAFVSLSL